MSADKTEKPTRRRERRAIAEGDVPVSAALTQSAGLVVVVLLLPFQATAVLAWTRSVWSEPPAPVSSDWPMHYALTLLRLATPSLLAAAIAGAAVGFLQARGSFAPSKILPDLSRLDPVEGFSRLFRLDRLASILQALVLVTVVSALAYWLVVNHLADVVAGVGRLGETLNLAANLSFDLLRYALLATLGLALVDVLVVRRAWLERLSMTREEVKREHKEAEGDPQLRQERRRAHQQVLLGATLASVKNATVVVINPTHYAVALFYQEEATNAPRVVASGQDVLAKQIIDAARAYGVPVVRDVAVARALHALEIGEEIPEPLYEAVAEILRQVLPAEDPAGS